MVLSDVMVHLKDYKKVARLSWPEGMYIKYSRVDAVVVMYVQNQPCGHWTVTQLDLKSVDWILVT